MPHALWLQHRSSVDHELQKGVGKAVITHVGVRRGIPSGEVFVTDRNLAGSVGFFVPVLNLSATTWRRIALCSHGMLKPYFRNSELKLCLVDY